MFTVVPRNFGSRSCFGQPNSYWSNNWNWKQCMLPGAGRESAALGRTEAWRETSKEFLCNKQQIYCHIHP